MNKAYPSYPSIRTRGIEKLNVLRSLSYKNWSLGASQQFTVYKSLIRSCLEYAAPVTIVNQQNIERLSGVQYRALKIIAKERGNNCSSQFLHFCNFCKNDKHHLPEKTKKINQAMRNRQR